MLRVAPASEATAASRQQAEGAARARGAVGPLGGIDVDIELPGAEGLIERPATVERPPTEMARGGEHLARPDGVRRGRAGSDGVDAPAINLAERDDRAHLLPNLRTFVDRSQIGRRRNGRDRASPEDAQVGPRPMMLTFVAVGKGVRHEQRREARFDPSGGAYTGALSNRVGVRPGALPRPKGDTWRPRDQGDGSEGTAARPIPGLGVHDRAGGDDQRASAAVADAGQQAHFGHDAAPSSERGDRSDTVDAEQESDATDRALMQASSAGGTPGSGIGGQLAAGFEAGSGGVSGEGSRANVNGSEPGSHFGVDPADVRRRSYLRRVWSRIHGNWSARDFPTEAALAGKSGHTIVSFSIGPRGRVRDVRITRRSGVPSFDSRMREAVVRAAPFGPLPVDMQPVWNHSHDFIINNPIVMAPRN